jgi:hypothetical protein
MTRLAMLLLAAACAAPPAPTVTDRHGEEPTLTVGTVSAPTPVSTRARHVAPKASRSRETADPSGTGSQLTTTAYCQTGLMANGRHTHKGAVAANRWPLGTVLRVSDSPYGPGTFRVEDRYGWGTSLDFATPGDCALAREWGRRRVLVEVAS